MPVTDAQLVGQKYQRVTLGDESSVLLPAVITGSTVTRPADGNAYAVGDIVANSVTAASVTPINFLNAVLAAGKCLRIERVRIQKTGTSILGSVFRVHLYNAAPVGIVNGDSAAWLTSIAGYIGAFDVTVDRVFTNGADGAGVSLTGSPVTAMVPSETTLFGLLEARGSYTPTVSEVYTVILEVYRF